MNELKICPPHIAESCVNHVSGHKASVAESTTARNIPAKNEKLLRRGHVISSKKLWDSYMIFKLIKAPKKRIENKIITIDEVTLWFKGMPEINMSENNIQKIYRRLEEVFRATKYLTSKFSKKRSFKSQQDAVVKAAARARPHMSSYDSHFCQILKDLKTWEARRRETRLMVQVGTSSVPIEGLFPWSTSAKPEHYLLMSCIHGIWAEILNQPCAAEPSPNLIKFAARVFNRLERKNQTDGAIRSRWRRYFSRSTR